MSIANFDTRNHPWSHHNIFVDVTVRGLFGIITVIVFYKLGEVMEALTAKCLVDFAFAAKLVAIQHACRLVLQRSWSSITFFSDCKMAMHGLIGRKAPIWKSSGVFDDILLIFSGLSNAHFCWISRGSNDIAHDLAAWATFSSCFKSFFVGK
uniref:RNase H type-1 domain-containing protein n=1 Tax=Cannabis sativa TaxID=3483 RepID=A0A803PW33_CANSA